MIIDSTSSWPLGVSLYSTLGGISLKDCLFKIPLFSNSFNQIIINSEEIKPFYVKNYSVSNQDCIKRYSVFDFPGSLEEFENILNILLQKNSINEYVVVQDLEAENTLAAIKFGDIEQLGMFVCDFCGAVFNSEDGKYIYQRAHYFF